MTWCPHSVLLAPLTPLQSFYNFTAFRHRFDMPNNGNGNFWFSYDYGNVSVAVCGAGHPCTCGVTQNGLRLLYLCADPLHIIEHGTPVQRWLPAVEVGAARLGQGVREPRQRALDHRDGPPPHVLLRC